MDKNKDNRLLKIIRYFCLFSVLIVCGIIVALVFANREKVGISLDQTGTLIFTVIGFLFAFAGINIYSIFNTNIDEKKNQLKILQGKYEKELIFTKKQWDFSKKLIEYYLKCQMVIDSQSFNRKDYDWLTSINKYIDEFTKYLTNLYQGFYDAQYSSLTSDFLEISDGMAVLLNSFYKRIDKPDSTFFEKMSVSDISYFKSYLQETITKLEELHLLEDNLKQQLRL